MLIYLIKGGPLMIAIGICSIAAGSFSVLAWLRLRKALTAHSNISAQLYQSIHKKDWMNAYQICQTANHPFLQVWRACFQLLIEGKYDLHDVQEAIAVEGEKIIAFLESPLKPLGALIAALPMLGFLGTILGLISSFESWEQLGANVHISALAGGIYQAMITTAAGLITAIPYHLIYHWLSAKVHDASHLLSKETTHLFRAVKQTLLEELPITEDPILSSKS